MKCTATSKRTKGPCQQSTVPGARVCHWHGGAAPAVQAAAAERVVESQARSELAKLDALLGPAEPVENPLERLQQLAGEADRWRDLMARRVAQLSSLGYSSPAGEQIRAEVRLYTDALDRLGALLMGIARLGIDARLALIAEEQARAVGAAVDAALEWAGIPRDQRRTVKRVVANRLRESTGARQPPLPEPLRLDRRIEDLERENANLRHQLAEASQRATVPPRLAIEPPRPTAAVPFIVDAEPPDVPAPAATGDERESSATRTPDAPQVGQLGRDFWSWPSPEWGVPQ